MTFISQHQTENKQSSSFCQFHHEDYPLLQDQPPKSENRPNVTSLKIGITILHKSNLNDIIFALIFNVTAFIYFLDTEISS